MTNRAIVKVLLLEAIMVSFAYGFGRWRGQRGADKWWQLKEAYLLTLEEQPKGHAWTEGFYLKGDCQLVVSGDPKATATMMFNAFEIQEGKPCQLIPGPPHPDLKINYWTDDEGKLHEEPKKP